MTHSCGVAVLCNRSEPTQDLVCHSSIETVIATRALCQGKEAC